MENRLIFLYRYRLLKQVGTEKARRATYWIVVQARRLTLYDNKGVSLGREVMRAETFGWTLTC